MPKRKMDLDVKVQAMLACLHLQDVEAVGDQYDLAESSLYRWFDQIKAQLPEILQEAKPGPHGAPRRRGLQALANDVEP